MEKKPLPPVLAQVHQAELLDEVRSVSAQFEKFSTMVVIGIGGSSLGLRALTSALGPRKKSIIVCDDLDPIAFQAATHAIDWTKTVVNIVSKSGGTLEIMAMASVLVAELKKAVGEKWTQHVVVTTDPKTGFLRKWATQNNLKSCQIPTEVGGRFSIFTAVGLLPLLWAGYDVAAFLSGAQSALSSAEPQNWAEQHVAWDKAGRVMVVVMPYTSRLMDYAHWFVQLWSESLGKNSKGQTPMIAIGTQDQHAQVQMFAEGPKNKCIRFVTVGEWAHDVTVPDVIDPAAQYLQGKSFAQLLAAAAAATAEALQQCGCPSYTVTLPALNESALGHLMMSDIMMTLAAARLYQVDPYGQPGVELTKKLWRQRLPA